MPLLTPPLRECLDPTKPPINCLPSKLFGIPQGNSGRNGQVIRGIVVHCLDEIGIEACGSATKLSRLRGSKNSLHYTIPLNGGVQQHVDDADIAYGLDFTVPLGTTTPIYTCPDNPCQPDACDPNPPLLGNYKPLWALSDDVTLAGVPFDYYLLHIGLEAPKRRVTPFRPQNSNENCGETNDCEPCADNSIDDQFANAQMRSLVQLVAALAFEYGIPIDSQHVNFWHNIDPCERDECGCEPCISQFICRVTNYCQTPKIAADATYVLDNQLAFVYGETKEGQKTAQRTADFLAENLRYNTALARLEYFRASDNSWQPLPVV